MPKSFREYLQTLTSQEALELVAWLNAAATPYTDITTTITDSHAGVDFGIAAEADVDQVVS
jgi:hypothetical protein